MTPRCLDWTLRSRGTVIADWPQADQEAAIALLRSNPAARAVLADALARDDADPAPPDRCALVRMQGALKCALLQLPPLTFAFRWGMLAACTAAGLYLGAAAALDISAEFGTDAADGFVAVQSVTVASSP